MIILKQFSKEDCVDASSHSVFMCFVWVWEETAIISLYSINWLIFVTKPFKGGYYTYHQLNIHSSTFYPRSVFVCLCGSQNLLRLFPCTALTDWFLNKDLTI